MRNYSEMNFVHAFYTQNLRGNTWIWVWIWVWLRVSTSIVDLDWLVLSSIDIRMNHSNLFENTDWVLISHFHAMNHSQFDECLHAKWYDLKWTYVTFYLDTWNVHNKSNVCMLSYMLPKRSENSSLYSRCDFFFLSEEEDFPFQNRSNEHVDQSIKLDGTLLTDDKQF